MTIYYLKSTGKDRDDGLTTSTPFKTFNKAYTTCVNGDTIHLIGTLTDNNTKTIAKSITIEGDTFTTFPPTSIISGNVTTCFTITADNVKFQNIGVTCSSTNAAQVGIHVNSTTTKRSGFQMNNVQVSYTYCGVKVSGNNITISTVKFIQTRSSATGAIGLAIYGLDSVAQISALTSTQSAASIYLISLTTQGTTASVNNATGLLIIRDCNTSVTGRFFFQQNFPTPTSYTNASRLAILFSNITINSAAFLYLSISTATAMQYIDYYIINCTRSATTGFPYVCIDRWNAGSGLPTAISSGRFYTYNAIYSGSFTVSGITVGDQMLGATWSTVLTSLTNISYAYQPYIVIDVMVPSVFLGAATKMKMRYGSSLYTVYTSITTVSNFFTFTLSPTQHVLLYEYCSSSSQTTYDPDQQPIQNAIEGSQIMCMSIDTSNSGWKFAPILNAPMLPDRTWIKLTTYTATPISQTPNVLAYQLPTIQDSTSTSLSIIESHVITLTDITRLLHIYTTDNDSLLLNSLSLIIRKPTTSSDINCSEDTIIGAISGVTYVLGLPTSVDAYLYTFPSTSAVITTTRVNYPYRTYINLAPQFGSITQMTPSNNITYSCTMTNPGIITFGDGIYVVVPAINTLDEIYTTLDALLYVTVTGIVSNASVFVGTGGDLSYGNLTVIESTSNSFYITNGTTFMKSCPQDSKKLKIIASQYPYRGYIKIDGVTSNRVQ